MPGPAKLPPHLRAVNGRREGYDSGGRPIEDSPEFERKPPPMPEDLDEYGQDMWQKVSACLAGVDLLRDIDEFALRVLCETYSRWRAAVAIRHDQGILDEGIQNKMVKAGWVIVEERAADQLRYLLREFGLTLSSEGAIGVAGGKKKPDEEWNPFAESG